jgi:hypothetical protein
MLWSSTQYLVCRHHPFHLAISVLEAQVDGGICWPNPHGRDGSFGDAVGCVNVIAPPRFMARAKRSNQTLSPSDKNGR